MRKPWPLDAEEVVTPRTLRLIDCLIEVSRTARIFINHVDGKGGIMLPLAVKKSELVRALAELDKES